MAAKDVMDVSSGDESSDDDVSDSKGQQAVKNEPGTAEKHANNFDPYALPKPSYGTDGSSAYGTTVFVRNLPFDMTDDQLTEVFEEVGPLRSAFIVAHPPEKGGKSRGFGFVQFSTMGDAQAAVAQLHQKKCGSRKILVEIARQKDKDVRVDDAQAGGTAGAVKRKAPGLGVSRDEQAATKRRLLPVGAPNTSVLLSQLKHDTKRPALEKRLRKFGKLITLVWPAPETRPEELAVRVMYSQLKEAEKCVKKFNGALVDGCAVRALFLSEKSCRVIVRNLPFKGADEAAMKKHFSAFGEVTEVVRPVKNDKATGFGFVQFSNLKGAALAVTSGNKTKLGGRTLVVDWALSKGRFESVSRKVQDMNRLAAEAAPPVQEQKVKVEEEEEEEDWEEPAQVKDNRGEEEGSGEDDDDDDDEEEEEEEEEEVVEEKRPRRTDVHKGTTVFIRNLAFSSTEQQLKERFEQFGAVKMAKVVMDRTLNRPKGTAFVQFEKKEDADALMEQCEAAASSSAKSLSNKIKKAKEPLALTLATSGVILGGRDLIISRAVDRDEANKLTDRGIKQREDKRCLYLAREGVITEESEVAASMSKSDLEKRKRGWQEKKEKLKNPNFFVSKVRLSIRNLPVKVDEAGLKGIILDAAKGDGEKARAVVKQVKLIRDPERVNEDGTAKSKGFGFVEFFNHEHALKALRAVNNNPTLFGAQRRPIVEFAVDDKRKLFLREERQTKAERNRKAAELVRSQGVEEERKAQEAAGPKKKKEQKCFKCKGTGHKFSECTASKRIRNPKKAVEEAQVNAAAAQEEKGAEPQLTHKQQMKLQQKAKKRAQWELTAAGQAALVEERQQNKRKAHTAAAAAAKKKSSVIEEADPEFRAALGSSGAARADGVMVKPAAVAKKKRKKAEEAGDDFDQMVASYKDKFFGDDSKEAASRWFD